MTEKMSIPVPLDPLRENLENRRLWIGNLDPRVTEFVLVKLLQQYGSIEKFDLLFHRSGPLEGQPRGYAFVTYSTIDYAKAAQKSLNGKIVGNKILSVKWAHNAEKDNFIEKQKVLPNIPALSGAKSNTRISKVTTIQAIEAKLKTMEASSSSVEFQINNIPSTSVANFLQSQSKHSKNKQFVRNNYKPYLFKQNLNKSIKN